MHQSGTCHASISHCDLRDGSDPKQFGGNFKNTFLLLLAVIRCQSTLEDAPLQ